MGSKNCWNYAARILILGFVAGLGVLSVPSRSSAATLWTTPIVIYRTREFVGSPVLISDRAGDVHLFVAASGDQPSARPRADSSAPDGQPGSVGNEMTTELVYAKLHADHWSEPQVILTSPAGGQLAQPDVALDDSGYAHVLWKGPSNDLYYSRAYVADMGSAQAWTRPIVLSEQHLGPGPFGLPMALVASNTRDLDLVYAADEGELLYRHSSDNGQTWSSSVTVANPVGGGSAADLPRLAIDANGKLHLTWTELAQPNGWPPTGAFYQRRTDEGAWTQPTRIAAENYGLVTEAVLGTRLVRSWNGTVSTTGDRRAQWSDDAGRTWSEARLITPLKGGFTGFSGMAFDSLGVLHLVTSVSGTSTTEGVYHFTSDGSDWSAGEYVSVGAIGQRSVEGPSLAIGLGNRLHVAYEDDFRRIWYTSLSLEAPQQPAQVIQAPVITSSELAPRPTSTAASATPTMSTAVPPASSSSRPTAQGGETNFSSMAPLALGSLTSALVLVGLILVRGWIRHRW